MALYPELQRLLVRGPNSLPDALVVDCSAIACWVADTEPEADPWPAIIEAIRRSHRHIRLVVGPTAEAHSAVDETGRQRLFARLSTALPAALVGYIREPLGGALAARQTAEPLGLLTAAVEHRSYELYVLAHGIEAVLDIATGQVWHRVRAEQGFGPVDTLPRRAALTRREHGELPIVGEAQRYAEKIQKHAPSVTPRELVAAVYDGKLPRRVADRALSKLEELDHKERKLRGEAVPDHFGRLWLEQPRALIQHHRIEPCIYAAASMAAGKFTALAVLSNLQVRVDGHERCIEFLADLVQQAPDALWVCSGALDVLNLMVDAKLRLPSRVVDPALCRVLLNPDAPPRLEELCPDLYGLSPSARAFLNDSKRVAPKLAPHDLFSVVGVLPELDACLLRHLTQTDQRYLSEADIAFTLPILATIERRGLLVSPPPGGWDAAREALVRRMTPVFNRAAALLGGDVLDAPPEQIVWELAKKHGALPAAHVHPNFSPRDLFERYVAAGNPDALDLQAARSLPSLLRWYDILHAGGASLRGSMTVGVTGRWSYSRHALHSLAKEGGRELRKQLVAPPGMTLISADWNAYEARLLASLSGDPLLASAAKSPDLHAALGTQLGLTRSEAKQGIYGVVYGQSKLSFQATQVTMSLDESERVYECVRSTLKRVAFFKQRCRRAFRSTGRVRSRGGWTRYIGNTDKPNGVAFNTPVQALGADILRFVLRRLHTALSACDASVVYQAHDELVVVCPRGSEDYVEARLEYVMNAEVNQSGLLPCPVPLTVRFKRGCTWADLI